MIGTGCIGSCQFNYHTITTTTTPLKFYIIYSYVYICLYTHFPVLFRTISITFVYESSYTYIIIIRLLISYFCFANFLSIFPQNWFISINVSFSYKFQLIWGLRYVKFIFKTIHSKQSTTSFSMIASCVVGSNERQGYGLGLWRLTPFQQCFSCVMVVSFIGRGRPSEHRKSPICRKSLTNYHIMLYRVHLVGAEFELTT